MDRILRRRSSLVLLGLLAASPASAAAPKTEGLAPAEATAAARVTAAEISAHIRFLSDDLLEGRFPGTRGSEIAIRYVATELEGMGLKPGVPGRDGAPPSWIQNVPLVRHVSTPPEAIAFRRGTEVVNLPTGPGTSARVVVRSLGDTDHVQVKDAELVFVGYGIVAPEQGWDDYRGVDVRGKVVVLLNFNPPFAGEGVRVWYGRWDYKYMEAARHGAAGALLIHTTESASYPWQVVATSNRSVGFTLPPDPGEPLLPFQGWIAHEAAEAIFRLGGRDLGADEAAAKDPKAKGFAGAPLGVRMSLDMPVRLERIESANVVGLLPGTDPALRGEAVVFTAHHDHLGQRKPPVEGQRNVFGGALDNASGCASVLAIARAAVSDPPRRSLLFVFPTAEEQGLLGSRWFARHPTVPAGHIAAVVNVDGINKWGRTTDVTALGFGRSDLDPVILAVAAAQGRTVHGDPFPDRGSYYRSDHFEFARVGIPGVSVTGGPTYRGRPPGWGKERSDEYVLHDYHQPTDEYPPSPGSWDLSGAVEDAQLDLVVGLRVANAPSLPAWKPGDEFESARKHAQR
ncbi:MAG TPA: M28 family peptidase [Anaeromyxobacteraceae bacterium]|nr:M28 family peptidase [Anaeromyxobacteraceae bacterium]